MKTFVINLAERTDRMARIKEQLNAAYEPYERFEAIRAKPGWVGCRDSHLAVLDKVKHMRWNDDYHFILVLEDDVLFTPEWAKTLLKVRMFTPIGWDMLYLGCSPQSPLKKWNDYLYVVKDSLTAHAILYNNRQRGVIDYILACRDDIKKIDVFYKDVIQEQFRCFVPTTLLATQWQSQSDTCKRSDVSTIQKNFEKYTHGD